MDEVSQSPQNGQDIITRTSDASHADLSPDSPTLKAYTRARQEIARNLHFLRESIGANGHAEREERCQ